MEHRSEPQALPAPVVGPVSAPGAGAVLRRTLRLLARRFAYALVILLRPLRQHAVFAIVVVALLGVVGWLSFQLWAPRVGTVPDTRSELVAPAASVENYIKGQQNYNAELMWNSLSPSSQASQMGNGSSKATMQSQIDRKRDSGLQFNHYAYVGGQTGDEYTMYTYYVDVQQNQDHATFPMTFLVDKGGKIVNIVSPSLLNDMVSASSQ